VSHTNAAAVNGHPAGAARERRRATQTLAIA